MHESNTLKHNFFDKMSKSTIWKAFDSINNEIFAVCGKWTDIFSQCVKPCDWWCEIKRFLWTKATRSDIRSILRTNKNGV
jgi:hypothetical protein